LLRGNRKRRKKKVVPRASYLERGPKKALKDLSNQGEGKGKAGFVPERSDSTMCILRKKKEIELRQ